MFLKPHSLVNQNCNSFRSKKVGNQGGVGPMIVIAENCEDSVAGCKTPKQFGAGGGEPALMGNVVPSQCNDVRLQAISCVHSALNLFSAGKRTVMNI
jgi:hypothetical protein